MILDVQTLLRPAAGCSNRVAPLKDLQLPPRLNVIDSELDKLLGGGSDFVDVGRSGCGGTRANPRTLPKKKRPMPLTAALEPRVRFPAVVFIS